MAFIENLLGKKAGQEVQLSPDFYVVTDGPGHTLFNQLQVSEIQDKQKVVIIFDHDIPAGSFESARIQKELIELARKGKMNLVQAEGIGYNVMLNDYVKPGSVVVSCGGHNSVYGAVGAIGLNLSTDELATALKTDALNFTVPETVAIYLSGTLGNNVTCKDFMLQLISEVGDTGFNGKAIDFCGPAIQSLNVAERMTLCALAGRTGAVSAFISEEDVNNDIAEKREYSLSSVTPTVALPGNLNTTKSVEVLEKIELAAGFIGGCTVGMNDLRQCAEILKGKRIATDTRLTIAPPTNIMYLAAIEEGLIDIFIDCGAQIFNPGCASCVTTSKGVIGDGEVMLSSSCYNYAGCNGTKESQVFVSNASTVAFSALAGYICTANTQDGEVKHGPEI